MYGMVCNRLWIQIKADHRCFFERDISIPHMIHTLLTYRKKFRRNHLSFSLDFE